MQHKQHRTQRKSGHLIALKRRSWYVLFANLRYFRYQNNTEVSIPDEVPESRHFCWLTGLTCLSTESTSRGSTEHLSVLCTWCPSLSAK